MTRSVVATDNFGTALDSRWTQGVTDKSMVITAGQIHGNSAQAVGTESQSLVWTGAGTFGNDQYAKVAIVGLSNVSTDYYIGVSVRATGQDATRTHYTALVCADSGGPNYTTRLGKFINNAWTELHSAGAAWVDGDTIEIEIEGTTLRLMKNGTALGGSFTQTDSAIPSGGAAGVFGGGDSGVVRGDNWEGGDLSAAAASPVLGRRIYILP